MKAGAGPGTKVPQKIRIGRSLRGRLEWRLDHVRERGGSGNGAQQARPGDGLGRAAMTQPAVPAPSTM